MWAGWAVGIHLIGKMNGARSPAWRSLLRVRNLLFARADLRKHSVNMRKNVMLDLGQRLFLCIASSVRLRSHRLVTAFWKPVPAWDLLRCPKLALRPALCGKVSSALACTMNVKRVAVQRGNASCERAGEQTRAGSSLSSLPRRTACTELESSGC